MSITETSTRHRPATDSISLHTLEDARTDSNGIYVNTTGSDADSEGLDYPDGGLKAYTVLFGSFCGLVVCLGFINSIGVVQAYVSLHQLAHLPATTIAWIFAIYLCLAYGTGIFVGSFFDKKGAFWLLVLSTIFIFVGLMGTASSVQIWHFILSFIALGVGNGVGLPPLVSVINQWFFKKRGFCIGMATCGGSVGGVVFPFLLRYLYTHYGYVWALRILAFVCLGLMLTSVVFAKERITRDPKPKLDLTLAEMWRRFDFHRWKNIDLKFWYLAAGGFMAEMSLILVVTYFPSYAIVHGTSESDSYLLLTVWNSTGILGRWLPGYISDKVGRFNINVLMLCGFNLCIFVMWLPFGGHGLRVLYPYAALGGFFSASVLSMLPVCLAQITAAKELGKKYSIVNAILSVGNLVVVPVGASIINGESPHDYDRFVVLVGVLSVLGTFFWVLSRYMIVGMKLNGKV